MKQQQFRREAPVDRGVDEEGRPYEVVPLSMVKGGELVPHRVYTKPVRHILNDNSPAPRGWYKDKHEPPNRRPRTCYTEALLTAPYGGFCPVGCKFCYVSNGTRGYRATALPTANPSYPDAMRRQVQKLMVSGAAYISSFTEAFHRLEPTYHITQRLSQVFVDEGLPIFYLSRESAPDWAVDNLLANPYSYMQWSMNTSNPDVFRRLSPGALSIDDWLKDVSRLSSMGIYVSIHADPILPGIILLDDLVRLVELGAEAGVDHFTFGFVEQVYNNRNLLLKRLAGIPGVDDFDNVFKQTIGGVYTVDQGLRLEWLDVLLQATRDNYVTMSTCFEYYDVESSAVNLAPWYTTSDQCHGRGVPIYYRPEPGARFQPLSGCYRKGCLYCEEYGTQACRNDTLLEAKALQYKDLRSIVLDEPVEMWHIKDSCAPPDEVWQSPGANDNFATDAELWGWV